MKIVVDKLPGKTGDCTFANYDPEYGYPICGLTDFVICDLCFNQPCSRLLEVGGPKNDRNIE